MMRINLLFFCCAVILFPGYVSAEVDCPHIRGAHYNANFAGNITLPEKSGKVPLVWETTTGNGYSGMIVAGGRLFTMMQSRAGQFVLCLNPLSGKELWRTRIGWPWESDGQYPGTYSTPTAAGSRIFFTGCYGTVGCIDADTGKTIWVFDLKKRFSTTVPSFGYACTPLVLNGKVFVTLNGETGASVIALNAENGTTAWKSGTYAASYSSPLPFTSDGKTDIVTVLQNFIVCNDPDTGGELWKFRLSKGYDEHSAWPIFYKNLIFCGSPFFRGMRSFRVYRNQNHQEEHIKLMWLNKAMCNDIFSSVSVNGRIYGFHITDPQANPEGHTDGFLKCLDAVTGKEYWRTEATGHVNIITADGKLIMLSEKGTLIIAEESQEKYKELRRFQIFRKGRCWTQPVIWNNLLFLRCEKRIVCISLTGTGGKTAGAGTAVVGIAAALDRWLDQYHTALLLSAPTSLHLRWYLWQMLIFLISAGTFSLPFLKKKQKFPMFCSVSALMLFTAQGVLPNATGYFVFTLPGAVFAVFYGVLSLRGMNWPSSLYGKLIPRIALFAFILLCAAYFFVCRYFFIPIGFVFPAGFIPALPLSLYAAEKFGKLRFFSGILLFFVSFTVFFWIPLAVFRI